MIKTTHKIMKGRQKYKSFFKVEPLSHPPPPNTHTYIYYMRLSIGKTHIKKWVS